MILGLVSEALGQAVGHLLARPFRAWAVHHPASLKVFFGLFFLLGVGCFALNVLT